MFGRTVTIIAAASLAAIAAPASADVKAGVDAWSAGDFDRAVNEWRLPAEQGDADALFNLAQAYRLGRGVTADIDRARSLYAEAAQKGHVKAADNYGLLLFQQGDQQAAMPLIRAASDRGDPRAQYVLGLAHFNADYADKDWVRAYALLTLAQGTGLPQAKQAIVQMDGYIPLEQRQEAQVLARALEAEASQRRAAQLAALDLGSPQSGAPVEVQTETPKPPVQLAAASVPAPTPVTVAAQAPVAASISTPAPTQAEPRAAANGKWAVQLGAFGVSGNADRLWSKLSGNPALAGTRKALVPGGRVTRLQAVGFVSRNAAQRACNTLKSQGQGCLVKQM